MNPFLFLGAIGETMNAGSRRQVHNKRLILVNIFLIPAGTL
jgi:hypothetical protein